MSDERKKSTWPLIAGVLISLPVLYVASFGPACWLASWTGVGTSTLPFLYRPVTALLVIEEVIPGGWSPMGDDRLFYQGKTATVSHAHGYVSDYASLCAREHWKWRFVRVEHSPDPVVRMDEGRWKWCGATVTVFE